MKRIAILLLTGTACILLAGSLPRKEKQTIRLRWVPSHEAQQWSDVRTGVAWSLSYLGAQLPKGSLDSTLVRVDSSTFDLHLERAGFSEEALKTLSIILDSLKQSGEYRSLQSVDLGRFLVLTLHSSWHYYAITGAKKYFADFKDTYDLKPARLEYPLTVSGVAHHHRIIRFNAATDIRKMAFVAEESSGSISEGTFSAEAFEVFDVMPNGQLRFAIYGKDGRLLPASPAEFGIAGKPSKCLWCHESSVLPVYLDPPDVPAAMSAKTYIEYVMRFQRALNDYRKGLNTEIDYSQTSEHTHAELLYIGFMEPSLVRIAKEWQQPDTLVRATTAALPHHVYEEFPFLGDLFHRVQVDSLAPYSTVRMPQSVREAGDYEPDFTGVSPVRNK